MHVTDAYYKAESFGRTLYYLLGIDLDTIVNTLINRLIAANAPLIREAIACDLNHRDTENTAKDLQ